MKYSKPLFNETIPQLSPKNTLKKLQKLLPKIGVTRLSNVTYLDHFYGVYVINCIRPNSQNLSISQGKGITVNLAHISAIMECMEAYHIENPPPCNFLGSFEKCASHNLINPTLLYTTEYRAQLEKIEFNWAEVENLFDNKKYFIPASLTKINTCFPDLDYLFFNVSSNGLAAGNSKEEAIFHAICEIIERDALVKWQAKNNQSKNATSIAPATVKDFNLKFIDNLYRRGLTLQIWEIISDIGIPAYHVAIIDDINLRGLNIFTGTGAHLSKSIALFRAISEAIQGRLTYIAGIRDDIVEEYYKNMRLNTHKFLPQKPQIPSKNYQDSISLPVDGVGSNLNRLLNMLLEKNYHQILLMDHTKPELSIPVVQIFIPGMKLNNSRM